MNMLLIFLFLHHSTSHNQDILAYAETNVGRKVGHGICRELIDSAITKADKNYLKKHGGNYYYDLKDVKLCQVQPGDILRINMCDVSVGEKSGYLIGHIAIVKNIKGNMVTVYEQNTSSKLKDSKVSTRTYDLSKIVPRKNGGIYFCRF